MATEPTLVRTKLRVGAGPVVSGSTWTAYVVALDKDGDCASYEVPLAYGIESEVRACARRIAAALGAELVIE